MENVAILKFVGYTRVSKLDQVVNGVSLEAQEARIREWAKTRGASELGMFTDAGISGGSTEGRPALAEAVALAKKQHATLVVYSLSRLARSTKDALSISEELGAAKANLVSLTEQIDTTSGMGMFYFTLVAALAKLERDMCSERTKMAMAHKRAKHERTSRHVPYGWDLVNPRSLEWNEQEQGVIRGMKEQRAAGWSFRKIAKSLEADGVKTKQGCATWSPSTIMRLCRVAS